MIPIIDEPDETKRKALQKLMEVERSVKKSKQNRDLTNVHIVRREHLVVNNRKPSAYYGQEQHQTPTFVGLKSKEKINRMRASYPVCKIK